MSILVCFDGSKVSKSAVKLAMEHASINQTDLHVVRVLAQDPALTYNEIQNLEMELEDTVGDLLKNAKSKYSTHLIVTGQPAGENLVEYAERNKCLEIVIGVRQRSKVGKLVFGSTAQYVILNAKCPVVSIK
ncbi:MAG: universal stress protein [SAR324 cluster bacterium]|nr:universal stress protein [SAR324 cluster bacterium]